MTQPLPELFMAGMDFFAVEVLTWRGVATY